MVKVRDIVIKLKKVKEEKNLSYNDIMQMMENNGDYISKSTLCRVFADGSENHGFRYEITIRPIAKALLDIENIEEDDSMDIQAMKSLLKYKIQRIEDLEHQVERLEFDLEKTRLELSLEKEKFESAIDKEKIRYHEKLDKERDQFNERIDFLKNQINLKDKRMDMLLDSTLNRENQYNDIMDAVMSCPLRKKDED